jgi:CheY-like chemotaxis protein
MARVLVIDDDEETRTLVKRMLVGEGHQIEEAPDGAEGLRLFGHGPPDVVLTDINMPGLDGHDVIAAIRVLHPDIPIIAISGGGATDKDELLLKAAALGAVEIITKPFEFRQLVGAVQRALSRALRPDD